MKKIALSSLIALFAVSGANAATNHFVGGSAAISTGDEHKTVFNVAPEFGWKVNSDWDLGVTANFGYDHDAEYESLKSLQAYKYGAGVFARYKVAQFGDFKVLLKGAVSADFATYHSDDKDKTETATSINAKVAPMITYDISEAFTLYAQLDFLSVNAGYKFKNDDLKIKDGWSLGANADTGDVANTSKFQVGFTYNF